MGQPQVAGMRAGFYCATGLCRRAGHHTLRLRQATSAGSAGQHHRPAFMARGQRPVRLHSRLASQVALSANSVRKALGGHEELAHITVEVKRLA